MCLVAFAVNASARWPLVIASNRDEFFNRPALPMSRWQTVSGHTVISGRDLRAGGTWLGMTPRGRIALLTNVREVPVPAQPSAPKSRGELVMRWLEGDSDATEFMAQTDCAAYGGFNLVVGDHQRDSWTWLSNRSFDADQNGQAAHRPQIQGWRSRALAPGVYGLSNAALDTPWPKTLALKAALAGALNDSLHTSGPGRFESSLWTALASRRRADPDDLPDTGLPAALETAMSSAFVDAPERAYGTRCSTLLIASAAVDLQGQHCWNLRVEEKTHHQAQADLVTHAGDDDACRQAFQWKKSLHHSAK